MEEARPSMRPSKQHLGEMSIKVPAPFAELSDLVFTAQYRAQQFNEPLRAVPLLFEGPQPPMRRLAEILQVLRASRFAKCPRTDPVMLGVEGVILPCRGRSVKRTTLPVGARDAA